MRRSSKRALAVGALLTLVSSAATGWSVAFQVATDDHHGEHESHHGGVRGLEVALHGHAHTEGTPPHEHSAVSSVVAALPGKMLLQIGATIGEAPEVVFAEIRRGLVSAAGPTHDPPPRRQDVSVLRI